MYCTHSTKRWQSSRCTHQQMRQQKMRKINSTTNYRMDDITDCTRHDEIMHMDDLKCQSGERQQKQGESYRKEWYKCRRAMWLLQHNLTCGDWDNVSTQGNTLNNMQVTGWENHGPDRPCHREQWHENIGVRHQGHEGSGCFQWP